MQSMASAVKGQTVLQSYRDEPFGCNGFSKQPQQLRLVEHAKHEQIQKSMTAKVAHRFAVPAKAISEQAGEFGLSEGHMPFLLAQGIYSLLQEGQRLVDGIGLLYTHEEEE